MRKVGALFVIAAFSTVALHSQSAAAFGFRLGPFHLGLPFFGHHHYHRHLYNRAMPSEVRGNSRYAARSQAGEAENARGMTSALLYPATTMPSIVENVFFPAYSSPWPFGYQAIFATAFAQSPRQDAALCQPSFDPDAIVGRIRNEVSPDADQMQLLQRLGGALRAAAGYLAKSCPADIPARPVARLQLMESQLEELAMALDIVRPPLQDFTQSLSPQQQSRFAAVSSQASTDRKGQSTEIAGGCAASATATDWSVDQISQSVQPTATQRDALGDVKQSFDKAASDLDAHCPSAIPPSPLSRLDTIQGRLDATWRATLSIQVALANFETKLSDAQRVRFDAMNFAAR